MNRCAGSRRSPLVPANAVYLIRTHWREQAIETPVNLRKPSGLRDQAAVRNRRGDGTADLSGNPGTELHETVYPPRFPRGPLTWTMWRQPRSRIVKRFVSNAL